MASFLSLPGELRNRIYFLILTADGSLPPDDNETYLVLSMGVEASPCIQNIAIDSRSRQRKDGHVAFLSACRLVNREATPLICRLRPMMLFVRPESNILEPTLVNIFELTFASSPLSNLLDDGRLSHNFRSIQNIEVSLAVAPQNRLIRDMGLNLRPLKDLHKPDSCHIKLYYEMASAWHGGAWKMLQYLLDQVSCEGLEVFRSLTFSTKLLHMTSLGWSARVDDFAEPDIDAPDEHILTAVQRIMFPQYGVPTEWDEVVKGEAARRITFYPQKHLAP